MATENKTRQKVSIRTKARWNVFGKYRKLFLDRHLQMSVEGKVSNQCDSKDIWMLNVVSYKSISKETWNRPTSHGKENAKCQAKRVRNTSTRQKNRVIDIVQYVTNTNWKRAGHIARMKDFRCIIRSEEWQTRGVRSVGGPNRRLRSDIVGQQGVVWTSKEQRKLETLAEGYFLQWKDTI